jgi:hypothetical protein
VKGSRCQNRGWRPSLHGGPGRLSHTGGGGIAVSVLKFVTFLERFVVGGFDTGKDTLKPGSYHLTHEIFIISKIDWCLCCQTEEISSLFHIVDHGGQYVVLEVLLVTYGSSVSGKRELENYMPVISRITGVSLRESIANPFIVSSNG